MTDCISGQIAWCRKFELHTGMDVLMERHNSGEMSFTQCAEWNLDMHEDHVADTLSALKRSLVALKESDK